MADIELVVRIDEKLACEGFERLFTEEEKNILVKAIGNGTPLPKGHGDLFDRNEITAFRELECNGRNVKSLDEFTVIIEADRSD